jgi:hypothetical protein
MKMVVLLGVLPLAILATIVLVAWDDRRPRTQDETGAVVVCRDFVRERLKAPSTAVFPRQATDSAVRLADGSVSVRAAVDSQNGFGAQIRTRYACTVRPSGGNRWTLAALDL